MEKENTIICSRCGKSCKMEEGHTVRGDFLCDSCLSELTTQCTHCGEYLYHDDNEGTEDTPLCYRCFTRLDYAICERCGRLLRSGDAYYADDDDDGDHPYCLTCHTRYRDTGVIHEYSYKPDPIFFGEGPRFFGIELEIDEGGERCDHATAILDVANRNGLEHIYCKHDGSLNDGLELVSMPASYEYHLKELPWGDVLEKAKELRYLSHACGTAGYHIHVSRLAFGETEEQQDRCIARLLYLVEAFYNEILKFSRRTQRQMERWAARYGYRESPVEILEHAKKGGNNGRYSAINLENYHTVEFRMFRGTLKLNTFIATLQFVNILCNVAISLSADEIKTLSWSSFVSGITEQEYPELVLCLKERRLYTNDIVEESEVEV